MMDKNLILCISGEILLSVIYIEIFIFEDLILIL